MVDFRIWVEVLSQTTLFRWSFPTFWLKSLLPKDSRYAVQPGKRLDIHALFLLVQGLAEFCFFFNLGELPGGDFCFLLRNLETLWGIILQLPG